MLSSALLMFSLFSCTQRYIPRVFWVLLALNSTTLDFCLMNIISFAALIWLFSYVNKFYPKANDFLSIFSILMYSVFVDIMCYSFIPSYAVGKSLGRCIVDGVCFNLKNIFTNLFLFVVFFVISHLSKNFTFERFFYQNLKKNIDLHLN
jgi:hypothetical protein